MTTEGFSLAFRYKRDWPFSRIRDVSRDLEPQGACGAFAWSVLCIETGGKPWQAILTGKAIMVRCWSPQNLRKFPFVPRHAVMWIKGKGFIDSTVREYRKTPWPHIPAWPVGAPLVVAVAYAAKIWGLI